MMFRSLSFVGVASAAIIESRPHEHLQMANAQLQNATEAVIKTAAVAGLAYAGAYMAAAGTTPGAYDSSRRSQASSTGQRYCDTRETDGLKYKCTAEFFNGNKVNNAAEAQAKVAIRNYWCCPSADLGGRYIGDMNGVCLSSNNGASVFAATGQGAGGCVYQGPCIGGNAGTSTTAGASGTGATPPVAGKFVAITGVEAAAGSGVFVSVAGQTGMCNSNANDGGNNPNTGFSQSLAVNTGIFGGVPGGYFGNNAGPIPSPVDNLGSGGINLGASSGLAYRNGVAAFKCCLKTDQGDDGTLIYSLDPAVLKQPISFCLPNADATPKDYTCVV